MESATDELGCKVMGFKPSVLVVIVIVVLGCASPALAQSSLQGYGGQEGAEQGLSAGGGQAGTNRSVTTSQGGGLPFTGMELTVLGGIALVLVGSGFALRRLSAPPHRPSS